MFSAPILTIAIHPETALAETISQDKQVVAIHEDIKVTDSKPTDIPKEKKQPEILKHKYVSKDTVDEKSSIIVNEKDNNHIDGYVTKKDEHGIATINKDPDNKVDAVTNKKVDMYNSVNPNTGIGAKDATGDYTFVSTFGTTDKDAKERLLKVTKRHVIIDHVTGNLFNVGNKVSYSVTVNLFKPSSETRIRAKVRVLPDDTVIKFEPEFTEKLKADNNGYVSRIVTGVVHKQNGWKGSKAQLLDYEGWIKTSLLPANNKTSFTVHVDALRKLNGKYDITYRFPNLDKNIENNPILLRAATPIADWAPYVVPDYIEVDDLKNLKPEEITKIVSDFDKYNAGITQYDHAKKGNGDKAPVTVDKAIENATITWEDGSKTAIAAWQFLKQKSVTSSSTPAPVQPSSVVDNENKLNIEIVDADASNPCHVFKAVSYDGYPLGLPMRDKISCDLPAKLNLINSTTGELLCSCDFKLKDGVFPAAITLKDVDINDDIMRTQNYDIKFSFNSYENNNKLMIGKIATQEFNNRYNVNFKATYTVERPKTETASTQTDDIQTQIKELKQKINEANAYNEQHKLQPLLKITPGSKDGLYTLTYTPRANCDLLPNALLDFDEEQPFWCQAPKDTPDFSNNLMSSNSKYHALITGDNSKSVSTSITLCIYNKFTNKIIGMLDTEIEGQSLTNGSAVGVPIKQFVIKDVPISKSDLSDVAIGSHIEAMSEHELYHAFLPDSVQFVDISEYERQLQQLTNTIKTKNYVNIFDISEQLKQLLDANATVITTNNYKNADDNLKTKYDKAISDGKATYDKLSSTSEQVKSATEQIKATLRALNGDKNTQKIKEQLSIVIQKITFLQDELKSAKQQTITDTTTITNLRSQVDMLNDRLKKLQDGKALSDQQKQTEIDKLNKKIIDLEKQIKQLSTKSVEQATGEAIVPPLVNEKPEFNLEEYKNEHSEEFDNDYSDTVPEYQNHTENNISHTKQSQGNSVHNSLESSQTIVSHNDTKADNSNTNTAPTKVVKKKLPQTSDPMPMGLATMFGSIFVLFGFKRKK